jgi:hypothetical protein
MHGANGRLGSTMYGEEARGQRRHSAKPADLQLRRQPRSSSDMRTDIIFGRGAHKHHPSAKSRQSARMIPSVSSRKELDCAATYRVTLGLMGILKLNQDIQIDFTKDQSVRCGGITNFHSVVDLTLFELKLAHLSFRKRAV